MIANDRFDGCFGIVPAGDDEFISRVVIGAVRQGFAVVLNEPGSKRPLCTLTARQAKEANTAAQQAAKDSGDQYWERRKHACGIHHAITDEAEAKRVTPRLVRALGHINLGIEPGKSRMIAVDVDTAGERQAFLAEWARHDGDSVLEQQPTVLSPGSMNINADGSEVWAHRDGGHYWFYLPDGVDLPANLGSAKADGGWVAMWADKQVLVPPSVRAEGEYRAVGQPHPAPEWLLEFISVKAGERADRVGEQRAKAMLSDSPIDRWAAQESWDALLEPDGWHKTGKTDRCGCPEWTAPGSHSSPKSATAHEIGCDLYSTTNGGPLHLWTDNPPEALAGLDKTMTKLRYVAATRYGGDIGVAIRGLGLRQDQDAEFGGFDFEFTPQPLDAAVTADESEVGQEVQTQSDSVLERFLGKFLTLDGMDSIPPLVPLIEGVLDLDTVNRVVGKSNHGKTFLMIDLAAHVAMGKSWNGHAVTQGQVVYMAAEGALGFRKRARAWERHHGVELGGQLLVLPEPVQATRTETWGMFIEAVSVLKPRLVVLDTQARITVGAEENSAKDMGILVERLEQVRRASGACVVIVHHLGHNGDQGRGSSAVLGAISTEIKVERTDGGKGAVVVSCNKQKDMEYFDPISMELRGVAGTDSAVLVGPDIDALFGVALPEESKPMWHRMAVLIHDTAPTVGVTQAKACSLAREAFGAKQSTVYHAWDTLVKKNLLTEILDDNDKGTKQYVVSARAIQSL